MGLSVERYRDALLGLLPTGLAWPKHPASVQARLCEGLAGELVRVGERCEALWSEVDPRTASECLSDWERVLGLPEICGGGAQTEAERRAAVHEKLTRAGSLSPAFLVGQAALLGFEVSIAEFRPFDCGSACAAELTSDGAGATCGMGCDDILYTPGWRYVFRVDVVAPPVEPEIADCLMECDDSLRSWGYPLLECTFERLRPAHTWCFFTYEEEV